MLPQFTELRLCEMNPSTVKLIFLLAVKLFVMKDFQTCACNHIGIETDYALNLAKYVSALVGSETGKDRSRNHLVTLIRFEHGNHSEVFEAITSEVLRGNPDNLVFIHSSFRMIQPFLVHTSSFFVITIDLMDTVS